MRVILIIALCLVSGAIGAGVDHYWSAFVPLSQPKQTENVQPKASAASGGNNVEVLGDRVRCDVRFGELHLPDSAYRSFFDRWMGDAEKDTDKPAQ